MSYNYNIGSTQNLSSIYTTTANIVAFNANTNTVTLDAPVDISLGYNQATGWVTSQYNIIGNELNVAQAIQNGLPATLSTDESGNFVGIFRVPSNTFQTGSRVFRVDNRSVETDPTTATSYAEATFTASGLATTSQQLEFSPSVDSTASSFVSVAQRPDQLIGVQTTTSPYDPIAQTFIIDKSNYPNGMFLYSIKLFFATKPGTGNYPVTLSVVPTLNGTPHGQALDYSTVVVNGSNIVTSQNPHYLDSTTYTEFVFDAPVYIQPGVLYAFILKASSPDYTVYYAQQNQIAIPSTAKALPTDANPTNPTKVGTAPYVGALFESQNSITWTADQTKDLMFVIDQCVFNTAVTPQINFNILQGAPYRKLGRNDIQYKINANNTPNLTGNFMKQPQRVDALNLTTTDFSPTSTGIDYSYSATLANGQVPTGPYPVTPGQFGSPTPDNISLGDGQGERLIVPTTNQSFYMTATMSSSDANVSPIIADDGVSLYTVRYMINNMGIGNNVIAVTNPGTGYSANSIVVTISNPDVGSDIAILQPHLDANGNVVSVYAQYQGSGYLTNPTITISGANTSPATAAVYGETGSHGGNSWAKYYTKKVVLTPGNDSGDLRVYLTAYQPLGTNIYVYYKILSSLDAQNFDSGTWQLMTQTGNQNVFSNSPSDYIAYEYAPGIFGSGQANNDISYTNATGQKFNNFIQFAIKVVMATDDRTIVPIIQNLQALALPSGTGM
jgi:hypothetical protein